MSFHDCERFWAKTFRCPMHPFAGGDDDDDDDMDLPYVGVPGRRRTPNTRGATNTVQLPVEIQQFMETGAWPTPGPGIEVPELIKQPVFTIPDFEILPADPWVNYWPKVPNEVKALGVDSPWRLMDVTKLPDLVDVDYSGGLAQPVNGTQPMPGFSRFPEQQPHFGIASVMLQNELAFMRQLNISDSILATSEVLLTQELGRLVGQSGNIGPSPGLGSESTSRQLRVNDLMWPSIGAGAVLAGGMAIRSGGFGGMHRNMSKWFQGLAGSGPIEGF